MSDQRPEAAKLVRNERLKLAANLLNTMAGSSYAVGVAAPVAAVFFYRAGAPGLSVATVAAGAAVWLGIAAVLHLGAQRVLGGLRE